MKAEEELCFMRDKNVLFVYNDKKSMHMNLHFEELTLPILS
jgi:hypothetical protein